MKKKLEDLKKSMKKKSLDLDRIMKMVIILCVLLVTWAIVYYFMEYLPERDQLRNEEQRKERQMERKMDRQMEMTLQEKKTKENKKALDVCLGNAQLTYIRRWNAQCGADEMLSEECKEFVSKSYAEYLESEGRSQDDLQEATDSEYYSKLNSCACALSAERSAIMGDYKKELKDDCYKRYPQ